jgi:transposase
LPIEDCEAVFTLRDELVLVEELGPCAAEPFDTCRVRGVSAHGGFHAGSRDDRQSLDEQFVEQAEGDCVALGRSRGGLSTKIHAAVDGRGRPLVIPLTPGQAGDAPMMLPLLVGLPVGRPLGRPRTRPDRVLADKAYSSRAIRAHLRARGIGSVIPEPDDQKAHRKRRGSRGGRPVTYDRNGYRGRNVIERAFNGFKHWRGLATRYDKHATVYAAPSSWQPPCSGSTT